MNLKGGMLQYVDGKIMVHTRTSGLLGGKRLLAISNQLRRHELQFRLFPFVLITFSFFSIQSILDKIIWYFYTLSLNFHIESMFECLLI